MKYQNKWRFEYETKSGEKKVCYPQSKEKVEENKRVCRERGFRVVSVRKMYIFNTERNQHNFMLIANECANALYDDAVNGFRNLSESERETLENRKSRADYFFELPLPIAYLTWEEWQEANEMAMMAVLHRQEACIRNGRPDLVQYC